MYRKLKVLTQQFKNSKTSLESYEVIFSFIEIIVSEFPEFVDKIIKESEDIRLKRVELNKDKGLHLNYRDRKIHNQKRFHKENALHQLDPVFPFRNLYNVFKGIKPENINDDSIWLFHRFGPDDPMPESDKEEYLMFLNKVYKKLLQFLKINKETPIFGFDSEKSILYLQGNEIKMSLKNDKTNAHYILKHIFESDDLTQQFPYREISEDTFEDLEYKPMKFYRACQDIEKKVFKTTEIDDFIEFSSGKTGWVNINRKYLK